MYSKFRIHLCAFLVLIAAAAFAAPPQPVDLQLTMNGSADPVSPQATLTYSLSLHNAGPVTAKSVKVVDTLPAGVTLSSKPGNCTLAGSTVTCTFGKMAVNATKNFTLGVTIGNILGTITNTAVASASKPDLNPADNTAQVVTNVVFDCPTITLSPATAPAATVGSAYSQLITASGGTGPYTFAVTTGTEPAGLTLHADGTLDGTPTAAGQVSFTVTATDTSFPGTCTGTIDYTMDVNCPTITLSPSSLPNGTQNSAYSQVITASGGTPNYSFAVTTGTAPTGLTLQTDGTLDGTPTVIGTSLFSVTATDNYSCTGTIDYSMDVNAVTCPAITLTPSTLPNGVQNSPYDQTITANNATAPVTFSILSGQLPNLLALDTPVDNTVDITGTPDTIESQDFLLQVTDTNGCVHSQPYTLTITPPCLFCDDFEDGVQPTWTITKPSFVETGGAYVGVPTGRKAETIATPFAGCQNCTIEATMQTAGGLSNKMWLLGWYVDKKNAVELLMKEENDKFVLKQRSNGIVVAKKNAPFTIDPNVSYDVKVSFDGVQFTVTVDGNPLFTMTPAAAVQTGTVGFRVKFTTGTYGMVFVD